MSSLACGLQYSAVLLPFTLNHRRLMQEECEQGVILAKRCGGETPGAIQQGKEVQRWNSWAGAVNQPFVASTIFGAYALYSFSIIN